MGFKKKIGCAHALYTVRSVVDYFTSGDSVVNLCALDISKAFNKVSHYYRAMHFSAKRGIAIARRLSVRPSVCL